MSLLDLLPLLHLLLFYSGALQYVIMSFFVCNYVLCLYSDGVREIKVVSVL